MKKDKCELCRFYDTEKRILELVVCRRYPPQGSMLIGMMHYPKYSLVEKDAFCGEFKPRAGVLKKFKK